MPLIDLLSPGITDTKYLRRVVQTYFNLAIPNFFMDENIELELRAEVSVENRELLEKDLEERGSFHSRTERLSVMYFGKIGQEKIDVRVRITNGECEIVVKSGLFGSHDRFEIAQKINPDQFLGMVKIFFQFGFTMKVGERETVNYALPGNVVASLVSAGPISYVEFEKMSSPSCVEEDYKQLKKLTEQFDVQLLKSEEEFDALCKRLDETVDWSFSGTSDEYVRLKKSVNRHVDIKKKEEGSVN